MICWLVGWLVDLLVGWLVGWSVSCLELMKKRSGVLSMCTTDADPRSVELMSSHFVGGLKLRLIQGYQV